MIEAFRVDLFLFIVVVAEFLQSKQKFLDYLLILADDRSDVIWVPEKQLALDIFKLVTWERLKYFIRQIISERSPLRR